MAAPITWQLRTAIAKILREPDRKAGFTAIARRFGVMPSTVRRIAARLGIRSCRGVSTAAKTAVIRALKADPAITFSSLAEKYKVTRRQVANIAKELGIVHRKGARSARPLSYAEAQLVRGRATRPGKARDMARELGFTERQALDVTTGTGLPRRARRPAQVVVASGFSEAAE